MSIKISILSVSTLAFIMACNNTAMTQKGQSLALKGNDNFKTLMAQGAGNFRPEAIKSASTLGLNSSAIAGLKIDDASGAWSWVGFDTNLSDAIKADQDLLKVSRETVAKFETELGFSPGEILADEGSVQTPYAGTKLVTLQRQHQGTPIKGAFINLFYAVSKDGSLRLSEIVNNSYGAIKISAEVPPMPSDSEAVDATGVEDLQVLSRRPVIQTTLNKEGRYEFAYASEYQLKDKSSDEVVTLTLDNASREIREAFSNHVYEVNQISAETYERSYVLKDLITRPLMWAKVRDGNSDTSTDDKGNVDTTSKQVTVTLTNTKNKSSVYFANAPTQVVSFNLNLDASGKTNIKLGTPDAAAMNVFAAVQETIDFSAKHLSTQELKLIEKGFDAKVNIAEACNAFYNGSLNFFSASKQCANTGLISDVVKHEWGHGLDDYLGPNSRGTNGRSGITDGAYSEGIGDILSAYVAKSPDLAPGFFLNDAKPLRQLQNNRVHPPANANEAEVHSAGLIIGGAFWDMHTNLTALYGSNKGNETASRLFLRHLMTSDRYTDAYQAVLRVDDDDNNTATKSPNYCNITKAFARHKLSGGEEAGADCLDTDASVRIKIDYDQGEGKLAVLASAYGAAKIIACPGKVTSCKADTSGYVEFTGGDGDDVLTLKGDRKFYNAKGVVDAKTKASVPVVTTDPMVK
ncbi:MAG: hypothetical protein EOP07_03910 [Proteobacteria bacterium]|nr:MAG: hypothetical protein EOP07_03910 [Pseudomonadota bacterium]